MSDRVSRERGRHAGAARRRPLPRQPLVRTDGRRGRGCRAPAWCRGDLLAANLAVAGSDGVEVVRARHGRGAASGGARAGDADVVLMAAAVADYRPAERVDGKRPKNSAPWRVELVPTADVVMALGAARRPVRCSSRSAPRPGRAGSPASGRCSMRSKSTSSSSTTSAGRTSASRARTTRSCS